MKIMKMNKNNLLWIPIIILALGVIIRLLFTGSFGVRETYHDFWGVETYTHDTIEHIEYIQFVAKHFSLPEVDKALEYPQQPLYYVIIGIAYKFLNIFFTSSNSIFKILIWSSCIFSIGFLIFTYLTIKQLNLPIWVQSFIVGLSAFTPPFVFQSIMISNDSLLTFTASATFFFLIKYIKNEKFVYFILSLIFAMLSTLTKISGGLLLIIILFALIYKYKKNNNKNFLTIAFSIMMIGFLCLGAMLYRAYIPATGEFRFVESYAYESQKTNPESFSYFLDFNLIDLAKEGQAYVWGEESVAKTLPTFLYGSFLFGEYKYDNIVKIFAPIKLLMRIIIILGLLFPIGLIANFFFFKKWSIIDYISAVGIGGNLILLTSFLSKYPSVCNSDFRYFTPIFLGFLILSSLGLSRINEKLNNKFILPILSFILISSEFFWIIIRIAIKIFENV